MGKSNDDFIFPIIRRENIKEYFSDWQSERKRYNKRLWEIAVICEIEERLTSYLSRHSMEASLNFDDVPINALSKMLGHIKLQTTEIHIKNLRIHIMDEYQEQLKL